MIAPADTSRAPIFWRPANGSLFALAPLTTSKLFLSTKIPWLLSSLLMTSCDGAWAIENVTAPENRPAVTRPATNHVPFDSDIAILLRLLVGWLLHVGRVPIVVQAVHRRNIRSGSDGCAVRFSPSCDGVT